MNKQLELLEFIFDSVYVDRQYDEISLNFTAGSMSLCCGTLCGCSNCDAYTAACVSAECDGTRLPAMLV